MKVFFQEHHRMPSLRKISDVFGWASSNTAQKILRSISAKGYLEKRGSGWVFLEESPIGVKVDFLNKIFPGGEVKWYKEKLKPVGESSSTIQSA